MNRKKLLTLLTGLSLTVIFILYLNLPFRFFSLETAGLLALSVFLLIIASIWLIQGKQDEL